MRYTLIRYIINYTMICVFSSEMPKAWARWGWDVLYT